MWSAVAASPIEASLAAAFVVLAIGGLVLVLFKTELGGEARKRRTVARAERARHAAVDHPRAGGGWTGLSGADLARLIAFRERARLLRGETLETRDDWRAKLRALWRDGYAGWIIAVMAGAFSMATHFAVWWLVAGGGWLGAAVITLFSTFVMVALCIWVIVGLIPSR